MVTILESEGNTMEQAIKRIINHHKDLRGFSKATIYRELPEDMKDDTYDHTKDKKQSAITGTTTESISFEIDSRDNSDTDWKAKYEELPKSKFPIWTIVLDIRFIILIHIFF